MRNSVIRHAQVAAARQRRRRIALGLLLVAALCVLFLAYGNWRAAADSRDRDVAQQALFAKLDAQVAETKRQRIESAKQTEAAARAGTLTEQSYSKNTVTMCDVTQPDTITVVVNKKHCFDPQEWEPSDLAEVNGWYLRAEAATHMQAMMTAASQAGQDFVLTSAYRSYGNQVATYNFWIETNGSQAEADKVSARPGYSDHQTGLAADLKIEGCALECFGTTSQYAWLTKHAAEYGFIQRYPDGLTTITGYDPEPWHWRYIGVSLAQDMKAKGIETLEMYFGIIGGDYTD